MHATVEIDKSKQVSVNSILFALFGMPVEELVKEIRNNDSGEYTGIIVKNEDVKKVV